MPSRLLCKLTRRRLNKACTIQSPIFTPPSIASSVNAADPKPYIWKANSADIIAARNRGFEASRVFRRLLSVRRSYDDDKEQVFA
jgi:hypothetical protein